MLGRLVKMCCSCERATSSQPYDVMMHSLNHCHVAHTAHRAAPEWCLALWFLGPAQALHKLAPVHWHHQNAMKEEDCASRK